MKKAEAEPFKEFIAIARKAGATRVVSWFQGPMWWEDRRVEVVVSACFRVALLFSRFSTPQPVSCLAPFVGF